MLSLLHKPQKGNNAGTDVPRIFSEATKTKAWLAKADGDRRDVFRVAAAFGAAYVGLLINIREKCVKEAFGPNAF